MIQLFVLVHKGLVCPSEIVQEAMQSVFPSSSSSTISSPADGVKAVQQVREMLWNGNTECQPFFAPPQPYSQCHHAPSSSTTEKDGASQGSPPPPMRVVERADLNCEMLTWQYEKLGDGDPKEFQYNQCPLPMHKADEEEGNARKASDGEDGSGGHGSGGGGVTSVLGDRVVVQSNFFVTGGHGVTATLEARGDPIQTTLKQHEETGHTKV